MWYKVKLSHAQHGYLRFYDLVFGKTYLEALEAAKQLQLPKGFLLHSLEAEF